MKRILGGLLFASTVATYAQILPVATTNQVVGEYFNGQYPGYMGYDPSTSQGAVLGSSKAGMDEDLLLMADNHEDTYGFVVVWANNIDSSSAKFLTVRHVDNTNHLGGMAVLRPMLGSDQSALVALRSSTQLFVYEIKVSPSGVLSAAKLAVNTLPVSQHFSTSYYDKQSRLALISTSTSGSSIQYHLATSNPTSTQNGFENMGRVDFITLNADSWTLTQPYKEGLTGGVPSNMPILAANARLGYGLAPAGDVDEDGVADLAVLAPVSTVNANGAVYIVLMKDAHTPKDLTPVIWNGNTYPWAEALVNHGPDPYYNFSPLSLSSRDLDQDGRPELLVGGNVKGDASDKTHLLRALHVGQDGKIIRVNQLGSSDISSYNSYMTELGPLASWNYSTSSPTLWASKATCSSAGCSWRLFKYTTRNTQAVRHYALEAGDDRRKLVSMDSLFHRKGMPSTDATKYTNKTLSGLVECEFSTDTLSCKAPESAKGSWSTIEVTATGNCKAYDLCKTQDTFYVYSSQLGTLGHQYRLPVRVLSSGGSSLELGNWQRWAHLATYPHTAVEATIEGVLKSGESPALSFARSATGTYSLTPLAQGIDTLQLSLAGTPFKVPMHVVPSESLIDDAIPATPGNDTLYSLVSGIYLKLPAISAEGSLYTYDIEQPGLKSMAEVVGDYLLLKTFDEGDSIKLSFTQNGELKTRSLTLSTKAPPVAVAHIFVKDALSIRQVPQGVLVEGLNGKYAIQVLDIQGKCLNTLQGHSTSSLLVPLQGTGLRIIQVYNKSQYRYLTIVQ